METMVLLVFLAIIWAGVGVYWVKTRVSAPSFSLGNYSRRMPSFDSASSGGSGTVLPLHGLGGSQAVPVSPGHSLTQPARAPQPGSGPRRGATSDQARLRRRNLLLGLFGLAALTLIGVLTVGGTTMVLAQLLADALLLGVILLLVQYQREIELDRTRNLPVYAEPRQRLAPTGTDGRY